MKNPYEMTCEIGYLPCRFSSGSVTSIHDATIYTHLDFEEMNFWNGFLVEA